MANIVYDRLGRQPYRPGPRLPTRRSAFPMSQSPAAVCACGGTCPRCRATQQTMREARGATSARVAGGDEAGQGGQAPAQSKELRAPRFQGDPVLEQVLLNFIHLKNGSRGPLINAAVQKLQRALIDAGFPLPEYGPDGLFGSETEVAFKDFQAAKRLPPEEQDGIVGPITLGLMDDHFAAGTAPSSPQAPDPSLAAIQFRSAADSGRARYSNPDSVVEERADAVYLEGPTYSLIAKVEASGGSAQDVARWDVGHLQDLTDYQIVATYTDGHTLAFEASFPVRDSARGEQRYPFYHAGGIQPAVADASVAATMMDSPSVQFPASHRDSSLQRIAMKFSAINWVVARQRNTGEMRFVQHAMWGFTRGLTLGAGWMPGSALPNPTETNNAIVQDPGMGSTAPSMTEAVYNDSARLVEKQA